MSFLLSERRHIRHRSLRALTFAAAAVLVSVAPANAEALSFFKNFFVSGNYVVAGLDFGSQTGMGDVVTGDIHFGSGYRPRRLHRAASLSAARSGLLAARSAAARASSARCETARA